MKAAFYRETGGPEVIEIGELPTPEVKPGEVLVRVHAAAVNPIDLYIRSGAVSMPLPNPYIPGCDLAGTVAATGPDVTRFQVGERVWGSNQGLLGRQGTFAEYASVGQDYLYPTPEHLSDKEAAAMALVGITAHLGLFGRAALQSEEIVYVHGGTGGVGSMVVQMAKAIGARVITTAGSTKKVALARDLGADLVLNYHSDDIPTAVREFTKGRGVDVWYETLREPDLIRGIDLMAPRGRMILMAGRQARPIFPVGPFYVKNLSLYGLAMFNASAVEQRICADDMIIWTRDQKLRSVVGQEFLLDQAQAAHRLQEAHSLQQSGGLVGKIVMVVP